MARPARRSANASRKHARSNPKNRSLNALAIAEAETDEKVKIPRHRLGDAPPEPRKKRKTDDDDSDEDDEEEDDEDMESDGEGHRWKIGVSKDDEDDSELDSDEAFGESDEEKFAGYSFAGSTSSNTKKPKKGKKQEEADLDESEEEESEDEEDENGEGWMDLSEMLDTPEERAARKRKAPGGSDEEKTSGSEEDSGSEGDSEEDSEEDEEEDYDMGDEGELDVDKLNSLHSAIASLPTDPEERKSKRQRLDDPNEGKRPSEYNLSTSEKLTLDDLLPTVTDPKLRKPLNTLQASKRGDIAGKLAAPLAKRQQDRLDRAAAYEKSKQELEKWTETVKQNREADHLVFPLPGTQVVPDNKLAPTTTSAPLTSLEEKISEILQASNMISEKKVQEFEELKTNKLSIEDVQARTAQMRLARELLFREEIKAKRLKKIKSKAYRRLKKRERVRAEQAVAEAMELEGGGNAEEDEEEAARKRAEARMSLRFKQSKWAKGVKDSGKGLWDEEAREGAIEMSKREEELRRRIQGKGVHGSDDSDVYGSSSDEESEVDDDEDDEKTLQRRLLKNLDKVEQIGSKSDGGLGNRLMGMKFMQQAEAAKKQQNQEEIEAMRKEFDNEHEKDSDEEDSDYYKEVSGRRTMGPLPGSEGKLKQTRTELDTSDEESNSDNEEEESDDEVEITAKPNGPTTNGTGKSKPKSTDDDSNPWLVAQESGTKSSKGLQVTKNDRRADKMSAKIAKAKRSAAEADDDEDITIDPTAVLVADKPSPKPAKSSAKSSKLTNSDSDSSSDSSDDDDVDAAEVSLISTKQGRKPQIQDKQRDLARMAFAGDDVVRQFKAEKKAMVEEEGDQVIDTTLPGWGNWAGAGVGKKSRSKNSGRFFKTVKGIDPTKRKDAKLETVIINEKRIKKNLPYNATKLPFPFENKAQYERSLRVPIGPEWTTRTTFQEATKPRVLLKKGMVVEPMSAPFK